METESHDATAKDPRRLRSRVFLCVYLGIFLLAIAGAAIHPRHSEHRIRLTIDANGVPIVMGVRLSNPTIRHGVYGMLHALGIKAHVTLSAMPFQVTNSVPVSTIVSPLREISQFGL